MRRDWARLFGVWALVQALCLPTGVPGQVVTSVDSVSTSVGVLPGGSYPDLRQGREIALSGVGAAFLVTSFLVPIDDRAVPEQGFDPIDIVWSVDRGIVGNSSQDADAASDWTADASILLPFLLAVATGTPGDRWKSFQAHSLVYAQTLLVSQGLTRLGKTTFGRARPYAYLSADDRPTDAAYDVSTQRTFRSMPSGHSASAWTGAAIGMTEHLLHRSEASWVERAVIGFLGGALAGTTSALRVAAGQHFPSDVVAGAGIGIATGVAVPLLHRGEQALPSSKAWLQMMGGALAGTLLGVMVAQGY